MKKYFLLIFLMTTLEATKEGLENVYLLFLLLIGVFTLVLVLGVIILLIRYGLKIILPLYKLLGFSFIKSILLSTVTLYLIFYFWGNEIWSTVLNVATYLALKIMGFF